MKSAGISLAVEEFLDDQALMVVGGDDDEILHGERLGLSGVVCPVGARRLRTVETMRLASSGEEVTLPWCSARSQRNPVPAAVDWRPQSSWGFSRPS